MKSINLIQLVPTYLSLRSDVNRQKQFVAKVLEADIENALKTNDGSLDDEDFQKIRGYYGFGVPAIVGEGFCTLRGTAMSNTERLANTYQGALTGLYDDFFDKTKLDQQDVLKMMSEPSGYEAKNALEHLFVYFLTQVHNNLADMKSFNLAFTKVFEAQVESGEQLKEDITFNQIKNITFNKGGYSLLFYRSVFENKLTQGEKEALYNVGALMQLGNDIFDVWKDAPQKIKTLVTTCKDIDEVRTVFNEQLSVCISLVLKSGFAPKNIRKYLFKLLLGISRCYVCLDQLEQLQKKTNGIFKPAAYTRSEMLCDMEKPKNMLSSLRYYLSYEL